MNTVKKIVLFLMFAAVMPFRAQSQGSYENHYRPIFSGTNPITASIAVFIDGVEQERTDLELGAFTGDICRASSFFYLSPPVFPPHYLAMPVIHGYDGDIVTFRLFDHSAGEELDLNCLTTILFHEGDNWGNANNPVNVYFETPGKTSCFMLVTDADMLVAGRQFVIGNACDGVGKLMGCQDAANGVRKSVDAAFSNHKTEQEIAYNLTVTDMPYLFTLNENGDTWQIFDKVNDRALSVNLMGNMLLDVTPASWNVEIGTSGGAKISTVVSGMTYYLFYNEILDAFYCSIAENTLYLFAKCEPICGSMDELSVTDAAMTFLVESGNTLEVGSISTVHPFNLVIEDGAQLVCTSNAQITVQKNIVAYADANEPDGWYTIASPVAGEIVSASNLISNDFDLFFFRETVVTKEWRNYKDSENNFISFESGRGYLYANSEDLTLNFKGNMNTEAATYAMTYTATRPDELKGFALVGNPFAHNIKKGSDGAIDDVRLATGYYTLTHSGVWETHTDDETIAPCQGILVQTSEAGDLTINNIASLSLRAKSSINAHLSIEVEGEHGRDKAFVYFGEGIGLNKIAHFSNAPMLYLRQDDKDFAIVHYASDETVGEIPVFFKASENGKYSISVANDGLVFDYLHLVDNLTGMDTDLTDNHRNGFENYVFTARLSDYAARFKLVYQLHRNAEDAADDFCYFADGRLVIPNIEGETTLQVIDMTGRIVSTQTVKASYSQPLNLNAGVYLVRMGNRTQKIIAM